MTLAVAWIRTMPRGAELVFAADSRLRQGGAWDSCPKIFKMPRSDALIAFAGETLWAYPIIAQTINGIDAFPPSRGRRSDIRVARGHALRVINEMIRTGDHLTSGLHVPETEFLFGGWSWEAERFGVWRFHWNRTEGLFQHETCVSTPFGLVRFIGDRDRDDPERDLVAIARRRLHELLRDRGKTHGPLDMEPLEVLVEMLRSGDHETIGGPPQVAKVYRHMNTQFFAVSWPNRTGKATFVGRELLDYEQLDVPVLDPDDPTTLPLQAREQRETNLPSLDDFLLPALEELQLGTTAELGMWSDDHGYELSEQTIAAWLTNAETRDLIRRAGEAFVLTAPPAEAAD